jgi:hypothetical protein
MLLELKLEAIPISVDGHEYYAVPKAALEAMFQPSLPEAVAKPKPGPKPKGPKAQPKQRKAYVRQTVAAPSISRADAVRKALEGGPRTVEEVLESVHAQGRDDDRQQVGTSLVQLRMAGDTVKDPDGRWRLAE